MTQEEKQLLLIDLCGRIPYQPLCKKTDTEDTFCECDGPLGYSLRDLVGNRVIIKPYLRPMSSMTEDEKDDLYDWGWTCEENNIYSDGSSDANNVYQNYQKDIRDVAWLINWLNFHHFDFRGLIEKGLALEAPEGMYKTK